MRFQTKKLVDIKRKRTAMFFYVQIIFLLKKCSFKNGIQFIEN